MVLGWQGKHGAVRKVSQGSVRDWVRRVSPDNTSVYGVEDGPGLVLWGASDPRPPSLAELSINQSINHTPCGDNPASDWQSYPSITQWGSTDWPLVGQLTGRPTWADQWMPWGLKGGAHLSSDFWSFYFSHAGTLKVGSYIFVLSVSAVVVCFFTFVYWKLYSFY